MENYISVNIQYLLNKGKVTQDNFGGLFGLGKGVINQYLLKKSNPKIETIQKICSHFEISIDDFVNKDLSLKPYAIKEGQLLYAKEPIDDNPDIISTRYVESLEKELMAKTDRVETLEKIIIDKEKIIVMLEDKLGLHEKNNTA